MFVVHGCPPSVMGPSLLLLPVLGTVCPNMSRPHPLCLFSEVASRLSSSGVPSHDFCRNFRSACTVTVVILGHFNRSFCVGLLTIACRTSPDKANISSAWQTSQKSEPKSIYGAGFWHVCHESKTWVATASICMQSDSTCRVTDVR